MLAPQYKWNTDATTVEINEDHTGALVCVVRDPDPGAHHAPVQSTLVQDTPCIFLKWFHLCRRSRGEVGQLLIIVGVPDMPEGAFHVEEVVGMTNTSDVTRSGYLVFCKIRGGNPALWHLFFTCYIVPQLAKSRAYWTLKQPDGTDMRMFLSIDGEACILTEFFSPVVQQAFKDNDANGSKGAVAATGGHQASDKAPCFCDVKGENVKLQKSGTITHCGTLEKNLQGAFRGFIAVYPLSEVSFIAPKRVKIAHGVQRLSHIIRNGTTSPDKVMRGFTSCGQQRVEQPSSSTTEKPPLTWDGSVDYDRVMSMCYADFNATSLQHMRDKAREMVAKLREDGKVLDSFMDSLGIPKARDHINRDQKEQTVRAITDKQEAARKKAEDKASFALLLKAEQKRLKAIRSQENKDKKQEGQQRAAEKQQREERELKDARRLLASQQEENAAVQL
ncbi:hypothetical protein B484DRAFT_407264 [Ochromonadaceae sp. CCMP2298]|nr:hypothetical protein B484DRAFT_407264 [Ochromonadaceae sp. CCMP2298]